MKEFNTTAEKHQNRPGWSNLFLSDEELKSSVFYYIEAQTRDQTRTDVIVDYLGQQYIIELKIWRGERCNADGEKQISEYLDYFGLDTGYMLSFNFNQNKEQGVKRIQIGDKVLFEGTV